MFVFHIPDLPYILSKGIIVNYLMAPDNNNFMKSGESLYIILQRLEKYILKNFFFYKSFLNVLKAFS
jgi:hypothetical protein